MISNWDFLRGVVKRLANLFVMAKLDKGFPIFDRVVIVETTADSGSDLLKESDSFHNSSGLCFDASEHDGAFVDLVV